MSRVPTEGIDYTSKDYESFRNDMIDKLRVKMPEYTDLRQSDAGIVILELLAQGLDVLSYYQDVMANEVFLTTEEQRSNALKWCKMLGYTPKASTPSEFEQVFELSAKQTKPVVIPAGTVVKTVGTSVEPSIYFETVEELTIPAGKLGSETHVEDGKTVYDYSVKIIQGQSISNELVGSSNGSIKNQTFKLGYTPVILDSIVLLVNEGDGFVKWNRVDTFVDSSPLSRDYMVSINDNDEAVITFGDGVFGKIPKTYSNGIYCSYRIGGGLKGNVTANTITQLDSSISFVKRTFNPSVALVEGHDKESLEEIKRNAPVINKTLWGALTASDFSIVTQANFPEIDKAASYPAGEENRDIAIYVTLKSGGTLSNSMKSAIENLFSENGGGRKIVGAEDVLVNDAIRTPVDITAVLSVYPRYDFNTVKQSITDFLTNYFAEGNYDFDTELSISKLSSEVMSEENRIEGIRYFHITSPTENVLTPGNGVIYTLGSLTITEG